MARQLGRSETVVFSVFTEKYAYACNLRQRLNKHFKAAGVTNVSFHGFRHTHTTMMLYAQVSPKDVQYRLGHSNLMMTENVYWHTNQENAKKLSQIMKQQSIVYKGVTLCDCPLTIQKIQHFNHGVVQRVVNSKKHLGMMPQSA